MLCKKARFPIILFALCSLANRVSSADIRSFTVHFAGCTEFAGWGPVSLAKAQPLVPVGYVIADPGPEQAGIVVRATSCDSVSIGQSPAQPTVASQIGINLVPPDGTGNINNYTVFYITNNQALAGYFQIAGLPAIFDPQLTYEYTPAEASDNSGQLYVTAASDELPAYFLFGNETDPPSNSQQSFLANWWFTGDAGKMKQSTSFPVISFGTATVTLYTSKTSPLGDLIGCADCGHLHGRYRNGRVNPKLPFAGSETLAARAAVTPDIYQKSAACESSPLGIHGERASACLMQQLEDVMGNILGLPPCTKH